MRFITMGLDIHKPRPDILLFFLYLFIILCDKIQFADIRHTCLYIIERTLSPLTGHSTRACVSEVLRA
jgi:hypothetical protein